jgi:hypothetical protein
MQDSCAERPLVEGDSGRWTLTQLCWTVKVTILLFVFRGVSPDFPNAGPGEFARG